MLRPRFFSDEPLRELANLTLAKEPSRHIARALRMRVGDALCLFDGSGDEVAAVITDIDRDRVSVATEARACVDRESPLRIILAVAISRGDRMDTTVQKSTELGVSEIWPLVSDHTGVRLKEDRQARKHQHWQRIAISACEQCGRNRVPPVAKLMSYRDVLEAAGSANVDMRLVLHPTGDSGTLLAAPQSLVVLVGPEGGFSDEEIDQATTAGFQALQLGPRILRTETAPLTALAVAQSRWGDFAL